MKPSAPSDPLGSRETPGLSMVIFLILALAGLFHASKFASFTADDAFITFRYARNLALGEGLTYNPGERVEGLSNPAFAAILALGIRQGMGPESSAKLLGFGAFLCLLGLVFQAGRRITGSLSTAGMLGASLAAASPLALWSVGGLETMPYAYLLGVTGLAAVRGPPVFFALWAVVLSLLRPEGTGAALAAAAVMATVDRPRALRMLAILVPLLVVTHVTRFTYYGQLLPHTFWAKRLAASSHWPGALGYAYTFLIDYLPVILVPLFLTGLLRTEKAEVRVMTGLVAVQALAVLSVGGDWMPLYRFWVPLAAPAAILVAHGIATIEESLSSAWTGNRARWIIGPTLCLVLLELFSIPMAASQVIQQQNRLGELMTRVGERLASDVPDLAQRTIALGDIGRIGYITRARILDLKGLVTPAAVAAFRPKEGGGVEPDAGWVFAAKPDWILLAVDPTTRKGVWPSDEVILRDPRLELEYGLEVDAKLPPLPLEYHMYRRRP